MTLEHKATGKVVTSRFHTIVEVEHEGWDSEARAFGPVRSLVQLSYWWRPETGWECTGVFTASEDEQATLPRRGWLEQSHFAEAIAAHMPAEPTVEG